jgi:hypothetical protein
MGREWSSPIEAKANGSLCNFQIELEIILPPIGIPSIKLPKFPPKLPTINLFCPFDEEAEEPLE